MKAKIWFYAQARRCSDLGMGFNETVAFLHGTELPVWAYHQIVFGWYGF